ncbi:MAG TPA: apolipoprotein N-acyltransferase [Burkholderiaceae bacterium]|nr:apolipoprotein N-acyltransferase [Burkholderiaceae bacterium]
MTRSAGRSRAAAPFAAALLGAAHSLVFVHTATWPLHLLALALLARLVATASPWRAAAIGLAFGTAWLTAGTWWLFISLHTYGGLAAPLAVLAIVGLSAFLSLYLAAALAAFARWRSGRAGLDALLFGAAWLLAELARGVIFTGFPWLASGYAHVDGPLAALAPWVGVYGLGAVAATLAAWLALGWRDGRVMSRIAPIGVLAGVLLVLALSGAGRFSQPGTTLSVTLLQGNVAQDEKFAVDLMPQSLEWTRDQLLAARGRLVVAPETVIPLLPSQLDPDYWVAITDHFQRGDQAALLGLPLGDEVVGYTNSAAGLAAATATQPGGFYRYDKHHLVPFGEFVPLGFHWFVALMNIPLGDFNRGPVGAPSFNVGPERIGANICYEDLFGEELAARFSDDASAPTIFANISNIGWFGDTIASDQHLQISRMRALEFQRPMLRATNTGATAVIDHAGRVTASLPRFTQGVLDATVQGRTGATPFARWASAFGLSPLWALGAIVLAWRALAARRARAAAATPAL